MAKKIFFVDDDKSILNLLEYTVKNRGGIEMETYRSGEECLKHLDLNPDLIVLDHDYSKQFDSTLTGLDIIKKIAASGKKIPTIILSQQDDDDLIEEYKKYGAIKYILKRDYFIDQLMETLQTMFPE